MNRRPIRSAPFGMHLKLLTSLVSDREPFVNSVLEDRLVLLLTEIHRVYSKINDRQVVLLAQKKLRRKIPQSRDQFRVRLLKSGLQIDPFRDEPWLKDMRDRWVDDNLALIKSLQGKHLDSCVEIVQANIDKGPKEIKKLLKERLGITERHARLIADDQSLKATADLTSHRMQDLGALKYIWHTQEDARVRPAHRELDGTVRVFGEGLEPGRDVLCRCWPEPIFEEFKLPTVGLGWSNYKEPNQ